MKEHDIRPEHLLERYLELSAADAVSCFSGVQRQTIPCIACGHTDHQPEFEKNGFAYASCLKCGSLFQVPRPSRDTFEAFYRHAASNRYWSEVFFPAVAETRRHLIFKPRAENLSALLARKGIHADRIIDVGAGYGILLDEWRLLHPQTHRVAIEPSSFLARECRAKGIEVIEDMVENVTETCGCANLVVCFEVLEHVHDPLVFLRTLARLVVPGGHVFVSTLGVDGFDIQILWEKSNSIFPPHHINFPSVSGLWHLFSRAGLVDVEITTPGVLDVDIVRNAARRDPHLLHGQRFVEKIIADDALAGSMQRFLIENKMSSHTWIIGRKPG